MNSKTLVSLNIYNFLSYPLHKYLELNFIITNLSWFFNWLQSTQYYHKYDSFKSLV